jgi:hypothetical protein
MNDQKRNLIAIIAAIARSADKVAFQPLSMEPAIMQSPISRATISGILTSWFWHRLFGKIFGVGD